MTFTSEKQIKEFIAVVLTLLPQYVRWPDNHNEAVQHFHEKSRGFPGIIGAIDGCHVAIKQPQNNPNDYYNRKQFHSVLLQGICDHRLMFIDIFVGMPGRMHDARVFRNSEIYQRITAENPLIEPDMHLLGDSAYPIMANLLTPFRDNGHLTPEEVNYNQKLSSVRAVIERAFGRLKGIFRRLKYLDVADPTTATEMVTVCCILHNFIIIHDNDEEIFEYEDVPENPIDNDDEVELENRNVGIQKRRNIVEILRN